MNLENAFHQVDKLISRIRQLHPEFVYEKPNPREEPFKNWFRKEVPVKGYSTKSGVYIFSNNESEILYIGKAAADNLGAEIYSKFGTASKVDEKDLPYFGNSIMAKYARMVMLNTF